MLPPVAAISMSELAPSLLYALGLGAAVALALRQVLRETKQVNALAKSEANASELTVLQPILGGDRRLAETLSDAVRFAPQGTHFLWLVDEDDPVGAAAAGESLSSLDGGHAASVRVVRFGAAPPGVNPKTYKLRLALEDVSTEYVAVIDDDTTVGADHLLRALRVLSAKGSDVGLYTGLPSYRASRGPGSNLVAGFVNAMAARTYLPPLQSGPPASINGMFWVARRADLVELRAIEEQLCDDLAVAGLFRSAGLTVHQGSMRQVLYTEGLGLFSYAARMHRWFVFAMVLMGKASLRTWLWTLSTSLGPSLLLWWAAITALGSLRAAVALAVVLVLRHGALGILLHATRDPSMGSGGAADRLPLSSVVAELMVPLHAVHALLWPRIRWRTRRYRVRRDGTFEDMAFVEVGT